MQRIVYFLVFSFIWVLSRFPLWLLYAFSTITCFFVNTVFGYRKKVITNNLKLVFSEKSSVEIKQIRNLFYKHLCDFIFETIKSFAISEKENNKRFVYTNLEVLDSYYAQNKSIMLWCGHFANWEWSSILCKHMPYKGYGVYKPLRSKNFDNLVRKTRSRHGAETVSNKKIVTTLFRNAKNNIKSLTFMLSDQTPKPSVAKHWDTFMGVEVPVFIGAEELAKKLDMVCLFLKVEKIKRGYYTGTFVTLTETPSKIEDNGITRKFLDALENQIKEKPEFYLWSHKRWKHRKKD